jgi:hypothetical protein
MTDEDVEAVLQRYRLREPPSGLAARIAAVTSRTSGGDLHWLCGPAAAAAVLAAWIAAHVATLEPERDAMRDAEVAFASEVLGGGEDAFRYAELALPVITAEDPPPPTEPLW